MARKFFGTDGIRGKVGGTLINVSFFKKLGNALGMYLLNYFSDQKPKLIIGRDTRVSATDLQAALLEGLGDDIEVLDVGVLSTPAIAHSTVYFAGSAGVILTASHNGPGDNGVKLIDGRGNKWSVAQELELETLLEMQGQTQRRTIRAIDKHSEAFANYKKKFRNFFAENALKNLTIVLDCANGATSHYGCELLESLGAKIIAIGNSPNGNNINLHCGSECGEFFSQKVREFGADWGMALDGDGDRILLCDRRGEIISGEYVLSQLALAELNNESKILVTTVQANGALDEFLINHGIAVRRTEVGDRNVAEEMMKANCKIGGEPSGHIINHRFGTLADGLHAGALFLSNIINNERQYFQFQLRHSAVKSIVVEEKIPFSLLPDFHGILEKTQRDLKKNGRVLVRYSGTEAKLRLLVEAETRSMAESYLDKLIDSYENALKKRK